MATQVNASIRIPTRVLDAPPASDFQWLAGAWKGTLEDVTAKDLPRSTAGDPFQGFETIDGTILNLKIGSNVYLEDEEQAQIAGARKQFVEIVQSDGERTIYDVDNEKKAPYWKLQQSQRLVVSLARALGQTEDDGEDTVMADGFLAALEEGEFNASELGYTISLSYKDKGKPSEKVYSNVAGFFGV